MTALSLVGFFATVSFSAPAEAAAPAVAPTPLTTPSPPKAELADDAVVEPAPARAPDPAAVPRSIPAAAEPAPASSPHAAPARLAPTRSKPPRQELRFVGDTPYLGSTPLGRRRFYTELGRDDLVEQLASNHTKRNVLLFGGAVLFGIGNIVAYLAYFVWIDDLATGNFVRGQFLFTKRGGPMILTAIGIGVAGLIAAAIGYVMDPRPLSPVEERELLAEHNRRGATARRPTSSARTTLAGVSLSPLLLPDGGGAVLALRF